MDTEKRNSLSALLLAFGAALLLLTPLGVFVLLRSNDEGTAIGRAAAAIEQAVSKGQKPSPAARREFATAPEDRPKPAPRPPLPAPRVVAVPPPRPPAQPFPSSGDIPVGMDKLKLLASYGKPNMITTEVTEGRALETFRYLRPEQGIETTVLLHSGRVVSANSTYY
ncbi:MAG TPA: hypothetical protein VLH09_03805 [Bryobacteraceae bacterium]|nr:hypothetical protein [Bryobacteraceae bacterium]